MGHDDRGASRRTFLKTTGTVATGAALAGCTGGDEPTEGTNTTSAGGGMDDTDTDTGTDGGGSGGSNELQLINATMSSLDPVQASDTASSEVTTQIFDGLMNWVDGGIPVESRLATDYSVSDDFLTYTFELKEGVTYHNGDEVTAQDVVFAWERLAASPNSQAPADILSAVNVAHEETEDGSYVPGTMEMEAVDDYTFECTLAAPFASATQVMANNQFAIYPEGIVGDIEGYDGEMDQGTFASDNPIGAGPFEFESWQSGTEAVVSAYDDYHGSGPEVDGIHWQIIADPSARFNYAMNENADMFAIPTSQFNSDNYTVDRTDEKGRQRGTYEARNGESLNAVGVPTLNYNYVGFNMPEVPKAVRQAMAYAMNQETIAQQVFKDRAAPAYHTMSPTVYPGGSEAYNQHAEESYPYGYNQTDLESARQVMEDAGYGPNNRYELEWLQYQSSTWLSVANTLRDKLTNAHIDMQIEQAPFSTLLERVRALNVEAFTLAWIVPWAAPDAFVKHLDPARSDPTEGAAEMFVDWPNDTEAAQNAIDAWQRIVDNPLANDEETQIRNEAAITMEEANWEDVANLPVFHEIEQRFHYDHVDVDPFGSGGSYKQKHDSTSLNR
ncbi:ABC transporter substrate-binding protein [Halolamina sediminis]|jgi:peptide/nickel transport system substrate-binding protein|uniref:ABC transporter substrate-binding protein n=1 Tax=Halolamina sediminis TaxID=1480675 RepID=UPI0006B539B8|nr:ABC transporter substrate-binding protein [Halolamina sediminis]